MLKQGRKREAKGLAVLYFIIGLIILLIILAIIWFALAKLDYSDRLDPETSMRPYVEETVQPYAPNEQSLPVGDGQIPDAVDLTVETPTAEPTPEPTPEPTATPTPEPTAEPTPLPAALCATPMSKVPTLPATASENGAIGITSCYVSQPDDNKLMHLTGYGYVNIADYDGTSARSWLIVTQVASGQQIAYPLTLTPGVSGLSHASAVCQNAASSDFEIYMDVSQYPEGIYSMSMVIGYMLPGNSNAVYAYYPFSGDVSFTVLDGRIITPVQTTGVE